MVLRSRLATALLFLAVTTAISVVPRAQTATAADVARTVESNVLAENVAGLKSARLDGLRLLASSSGAGASLMRYTVAYVDWRLSFNPAVDAREQQNLIDEAKTQLEAVTSANGQDAEALALLAVVYGAQIAKKPDLGMTLGPAADELLGRALGLEPNNPRVLLLRGQDVFHTPPEYGGSVREAENFFRKAVQRFDQEPASKPWPNWGRFDAHVWLGQALADRHDKAGAKAEYDLALKIAPNSTWVKDLVAALK